MPVQKAKPERKYYHCVPVFKQLLEKYVNCHKRNHPSFFSGSKLNAYSNSNVLKEKVEYRVCADMARRVSAHKFDGIATQQSSIIRIEKLLPLANGKVKHQECARKTQRDFRMTIELKDELGNLGFQKQIMAAKENFV